jgi:serine/threonine-protein kinase HipA
VKDKTLAVLLYGKPIGTLCCDRNARLRFVYGDKARTARDAVPLSLSLPLAKREHDHAAVDAFLWGLLPDNERVLERWARNFQVSARNPFALLAHVGEDCAGAVQIVSADRVSELQEPGPVQVKWLTKREVGERLRLLREDETAWRRSDDEGQFSLAGAQPKTALLRYRSRWGVPIGKTPTTHILKPPSALRDGQIENEHFCLRLARTLGLPTAESSIERFDGEVAIVIERYDRVRLTASMAAHMAAQAAAEATAAAAERGSPQNATRAADAAARAAGFAQLAKTQPVLRLHQEDMCQALGVRPQSKYQNEGGPSPEQIAELLQAHSDRPHEDVQAFAAALLYNWIVGGSDGHAKNYSLLHAAGGRVRLAPFYDIASALPYPELNTPRLKLAMKIGGHYRLREIGSRELRKLATGMRLDPDALVARGTELCAALPPAVQTLHEQCKGEGLDHAVLDQLVRVLVARAKACSKELKT